MKIEAVLFDADGVVVFPWRFARYLEREHAITAEMTRSFFQGAFERCLAGKADLKQALLPYLAEWGWEATVDEFVETWLEKDNVVDERVAGVVRALQRAGFICCLATSQERYRAAYIREVMGLDEIFDQLFFSCELGYMKPNEGFYVAVEASLGLTGESILFWDDSACNVAAARERGWHAEMYTSFEEFEEKLTLYCPEYPLAPSTIVVRPTSRNGEG